MAQDGAGVINLTLGTLQRMDVQFGGACVASVAGGTVNRDGAPGSLPVGAALRNGRFYWQPGPAFRGQYAFRFAVTDCSGATSIVTVTVDVRAE